MEGQGTGDINHRGTPVRVASGTKWKHLAKGQDFSPQALGPTTTTLGGQGSGGSTPMPGERALPKTQGLWGEEAGGDVERREPAR